MKATFLFFLGMVVSSVVVGFVARFTLGESMALTSVGTVVAGYVVFYLAVGCRIVEYSTKDILAVLSIQDWKTRREIIEALKRRKRVGDGFLDEIAQSPSRAWIRSSLDRLIEQGTVEQRKKLNTVTGTSPRVQDEYKLTSCDLRERDGIV